MEIRSVSVLFYFRFFSPRFAFSVEEPKRERASERRAGRQRETGGEWPHARRVHGLTHSGRALDTMAPKEKTKGEVSDLKAKLAAVIKHGTLPTQKDGGKGSAGKGQSMGAPKGPQLVRSSRPLPQTFPPDSRISLPSPLAGASSH